MYDSSTMPGAAAYDYPHYSTASSQKVYPTAHSTSSAFSTSANANEDWTKISDLAERRRIQNRIAQRNYRKKLKKRLEDLERRAGSSSASPEQSHEELPERDPDTLDSADTTGTSRQRSKSNQSRRDHAPDVFNQHYTLPAEDRNMFSQQYTRQMSTSPPPFSYASLPPAESMSYGSCQPAATYYMPRSVDGIPTYHSYRSSRPQQYGSSIPIPPQKQEYYGDDEISPFSMSYASMAGVDFPYPNSYQAAYVSNKSRLPTPYQQGHTYPAHGPTNVG